MKKKLLSFAFFLAALPLLTNCAAQKDVNTLYYRLRVVDKKIEDLESGTIAKIQRRQASSLSNIDELQQQLLVIEGKINELAHFNRQLKEQNKELDLSFQQYTSNVQKEIQKERQEFESIQKKKENQLSSLEQKVVRQQQLLKKIQEARLREARRKAEAAAQKAELARERAKASSSASSSSSNGDVRNISPTRQKVMDPQGRSPQQQSSQAKQTKQVQQVQQLQQKEQEEQQENESNAATPQTDLFAAAQKSYANGNFEQAFKDYEAYSKKGSGEKLITAKFMMGECLYQQKKYDQAILMYQKVISNHPQHRRAASALLKQGMSFEKLSDSETAGIIYKKIMSSYASSPEAETARERSAAL